MRKIKSNELKSKIEIDLKTAQKMIRNSKYKHINIKSVSKPFFVKDNNLIFEFTSCFPSSWARQAGEDWVPLLVKEACENQYIVLDGYHRFVAWMQGRYCEVKFWENDIEVIEIKEK